MSVEFLVKVRDGADKIMEGAALVKDAANERLETMAPVDIRDQDDFDMLKWIEKGDAKPYQQTKKADNLDNLKQFLTLQEKLREKNGFWTTKNYKFWFHMNDKDTIDRRRK